MLLKLLKVSIRYFNDFCYLLADPSGITCFFSPTIVELNILFHNELDANANANELDLHFYFLSDEFEKVGTFSLFLGISFDQLQQAFYISLLLAITLNQNKIIFTEFLKSL